MNCGQVKEGIGEVRERLIFAIVIGISLACSVAASAEDPLPSTIGFLRELGIDPESAEVRAVINDQGGLAPDGRPFSLNTIAALRSAGGVQGFLATRNFIYKLRRDPKTPFPPHDVYQTRYLNPDEVQFIRTALAGKLQPKAVAFLQEMQIDPNSAQVTAILGDQIGLSREGIPYSLDMFAARRSEDGVREFIVTRNFVRAFRQNTKTPFPKADYQTRYLSPDEAKFIANALKDQILRPLR